MSNLCGTSGSRASGNTTVGSAVDIATDMGGWGEGESGGERGLEGGRVERDRERGEKDARRRLWERQQGEREGLEMRMTGLFSQVMALSSEVERERERDPKRWGPVKKSMTPC